MEIPLGNYEPQIRNPYYNVTEPSNLGNNAPNSQGMNDFCVKNEIKTENIDPLEIQTDERKEYECVFSEIGLKTEISTKQEADYPEIEPEVSTNYSLKVNRKFQFSVDAHQGQPVLTIENVMPSVGVKQIVDQLPCDDRIMLIDEYELKEPEHVTEVPVIKLSKVFTQPETLKEHIHSIHDNLPLPVHDSNLQNSTCEKEGASLDISCEIDSNLCTDSLPIEGYISENMTCEIKSEVHSSNVPRVKRIKIKKEKNLRKITRNRRTTRKYFCTKCQKNFLNEDQLAKHKHRRPKNSSAEKSHDVQKMYRCKLCPKMFGELRKLKIHHINHSRKEYNFECDVCSLKFTKACRLKSHQRVHTGEKPFVCAVCGEKFQRSDQLFRHRNAHAGQNVYKCEICPETFKELSELRLHHFVHNPKVTEFPCDVCGLKFKTAFRLKAHQRIHTGEKPFVCDVCGARFTRNNTLQHHKKTHYAPNMYKCEICPESFRFERELRLHHLYHHDAKVKKIICGVCGAKFLRNDNLMQHGANFHPGQNLYKCEVCSETFKESHELRRHHLIHSPLVKRFICDVCDRRFLLESVMERHKTLHYHERTYTCENCNKTFPNLDEIKTHIREMHYNNQ